MVHPIATALLARGWTQLDLVERVNKLRYRRRNGRRLRITQPHVSAIVTMRRAASPEVAYAIADALGGEPSGAQILEYQMRR